VGGLTLKTNGQETVELAEARDTWCEILGQALSPVARSISANLGREVNWNPGTEPAQAPGVLQWASVYLAFAGEPLPPLLVGLSPKLVELISALPDSSELERQEPGAPAPDQPDAPSVPTTSRTLELLLDVDLPVSISFGRAQLAMKDVLKLTTGSIVELNRGVNDPVEVLVNHCLIARGEVVVVEGNYGVRIQEIASRQDRLRSIR
jgi:flagellar motor switch protein FliN/FliY